MRLAEALDFALGSRGADAVGDVRFSVEVDAGSAPVSSLIGKCSCVNAGPVGSHAASTVLFDGFSSKQSGGRYTLVLNYAYRATGWNTAVVHGVLYKLRNEAGETPYPETDLPDLG